MVLGEHYYVTFAPLWNGSSACRLSVCRLSVSVRLTLLRPTLPRGRRGTPSTTGGGSCALAMRSHFSVSVAFCCFSFVAFLVWLWLTTSHRHHVTITFILFLPYLYSGTPPTTGVGSCAPTMRSHFSVSVAFCCFSFVAFLVCFCC